MQKNLADVAAAMGARRNGRGKRTPLVLINCGECAVTRETMSCRDPLSSMILSLFSACLISNVCMGLLHLHVCVCIAIKVEMRAFTSARSQLVKGFARSEKLQRDVSCCQAPLSITGEATNLNVVVADRNPPIVAWRPTFFCNDRPFHRLCFVPKKFWEIN